MSRAGRAVANVADIGRSLGLVLGFTLVVLLLGAGRVLLFPGHAGPAPVDYPTEVAVASREAGVPLPAPSSPPPGWRATTVSVSGTPVQLRIGFTATDGRFVGLVDGVGPAAGFLTGQLGTAGATARAQPVLVGGRRWQLRHDGQGDPALVCGFPGVTVLLIGDGPVTDLTRLAATLPG